MTRVRLAVRPFIGALVTFLRPAPPIRPTRKHYIVKHQRIATYWRDPYGRYTNAGDPRSDWTPHRHKAYRFAKSHHAVEALASAGETGVVIETVTPV